MNSVDVDVCKRRYSVLSAVLIGSIMGPLDGSVVNIAMPTFEKFFKVSMGTVGWVSMSYLLVLSSMLLTYGRLGDMIGYKRLYQYGMLIFAVASAICGFSSNIGLLIVFRGIQALGAGMMMSMAPAIITKVFPSNERGKALGFNAMAVAVGLAIGPTLGGFLISSFSWRAIFYINVPIGLTGYIWTEKVLHNDKTDTKEKFDIAGAAAAFVFLISLLLYISMGETWGWGSIIGISLIIIFILFFCIFMYIELHGTEPMLDITLFKNRIFTAGNLSGMFNFIAQFIMTFLTPFYLTYRGFSTREIGLFMTAFPLAVLIMAPISGTLSDKLGARSLSTAGALVCTISLYFMTLLGQNSRPFDVIWRLAFFGIGNGLFQSPNNSEVMGSAPRERLGIASSVLATMRNVGMVLGIALGGAVFAARKVYFTNIGFSEGISYIFGIRDAYMVATVIALLSAVTSLVRGKKN